METISRFLFTASVLLAMAFTLSCSDDSSSDSGGNAKSDCIKSEIQIKANTLDDVASACGATRSEVLSQFPDKIGSCSKNDLSFNKSIGNIMSECDASEIPIVGGGSSSSGGNGSGSNPTTWTEVSNTTFGTNIILDIAWGVDKFVAVGHNGKMAYSSNGTSWTAIGTSTFDSNNINCIVWGGDKFVAGGDDGSMAYSTNGTSWTAVANSTFVGSDYIKGIAYGGGKFVAVGVEFVDGGLYADYSKGKMAYSSNGISWTAVANHPFKDEDDDIEAIAYGGGRFVAGSYSGKMAYSTDGISWTAVPTPPFGYNDIINAIAYGGDRFVAGTGYGKTAYSTNGINWTVVSSTLAGDIYSIAYGNGKFVAGGFGANVKMAYSSNGTSWTTVSVNAFSPVTSAISGIAYGDGKFVAVGHNGTTTKIAYSN